MYRRLNSLIALTSELFVTRALQIQATKRKKAKSSTNETEKLLNGEEIEASLASEIIYVLTEWDYIDCGTMFLVICIFPPQLHKIGILAEPFQAPP